MPFTGDEEYEREARFVGSVAFYWILGITLALVIGSFIWYSVEGQLMNMHTRNVHHSVGYVDSRNSHMRDQITQYKKDALDLQTTVKGNSQAEAATTAHMASILIDVHNTAAELDEDEVARDVAQFLIQHQSE